MSSTPAPAIASPAPDVKPIQVGIIGLGFMGTTHIKAWLACRGAKLAVICNPSGRHLDGDFTDVSGNLGSDAPLKLDMTQVRGLRSFEELLADPSIDLIDICTPTHTHRELAIQALQAGKHVLCEKPMARTSADARAMADAAVAADRILMPAMCLRFWPEWAWLKEAVASGRYGKVLSAHFTRIAEPPAWGQAFFFDGAKSGGGLLDLHIHDTDFVRHVFGHPTKVESSGYTKVSGCIDHVLTRYHVSGGAVVHAEGSWAMAPGFGFRMGYVVNFEKATADYDSSRSSEALVVAAEGKKETVVCEGPTGHVAQAQHLVDAIASGTRPTVVTAEDGVAALEVCEMEERACGE